MPKQNPAKRIISLYPKIKTTNFSDHQLRPYSGASAQPVIFLLSQPVKTPVKAKVQRIKMSSFVSAVRFFFKILNLVQIFNF